MKQTLTSAVMTSIEALLQVPGTQLQHIESTLRQLLQDLKKAGITPPAELDSLIEDAAIAHAEDMAYMNGVAYDDDMAYAEDRAYDEWWCMMKNQPPFDVIEWMNEIPAPSPLTNDGVEDELPF